MPNEFYQKHLDRQREKSSKTDQLLDDLKYRIPDDLFSLVGIELKKQTPTATKWTFVMISSQQNIAVLDWLEEHSTRRHEAMRLWSRLFTCLHSGTGEIMASREELAKMSNISARHVSIIMGELASINAIQKRKQGRHVVYFMNPNVGTNFTAEKRDHAQKDFGQLQLV